MIVGTIIPYRNIQHIGNAYQIIESNSVGGHIIGSFSGSWPAHPGVSVPLWV